MSTNPTNSTLRSEDKNSFPPQDWVKIWAHIFRRKNKRLVNHDVYKTDSSSLFEWRKPTKPSNVLTTAVNATIDIERFDQSSINWWRKHLKIQWKASHLTAILTAIPDDFINTPLETVSFLLKTAASPLAFLPSIQTSLSLWFDV